MNSQTKKPSINTSTNDSLIEQLRDVGRGVTRTVTQDVISGVAQDALSSLFGAPKSGDIKPGQQISLDQTGQDEHIEPPNFPERFPWRKARPEVQRVNTALNESIARLRDEETRVAQKIEEVRMELKALIAALRMVDKQIEKAVDEELVGPGVYHVNFLDRLKIILRLMRQNMADSSSWLTVMRSRKKERKYWNQYKKKGTTFGLSHERTVATQVG